MSTTPPWGDGPLVGYVLRRVTVDGERRTELRNALLGLILASEQEDPRAELRVWEHKIGGTTVADWLRMETEDRPRILRARVEDRLPPTLQDAAIAAGFDIPGNAVSGYVQQQVEERGLADLRSSGRDVLYTWPDGTWAAFRCWAPAEEQESGQLVVARKADMWRQLDRNPFARDTIDEEVEERLGERVDKHDQEPSGWTCYVCGEMHPHDHEGVWTKDGGRCVGCETAPPRETDCHMGVHHHEGGGPCVECGAPPTPERKAAGTTEKAGAPVVSCSYCGRSVTVPASGERCQCPECHQPVWNLDPSPTVAKGFAAVHGDQRSAPIDWVAWCRDHPTKPRKQRELVGGQPACERCGKPIMAGQMVVKPVDYKGRKRMHGECL